MSDFLVQYGLFLAKSATIVIAIIAVILLVARVASRRSHGEGDNLEIKKLNDRFDDMRMALNSEILPRGEFKKVAKDEKARVKEHDKHATSTQPRVFVFSFDGDIKASAVANLREEITAVLMVARPEDEIFIKLNSSGGLVHSYGLAASQLTRIRKRGIPLIVSIDKVAASGGYMMACVANRIIAAPFSVVGSIGVLAQLPNFSRLLKNNHIDYEQFTAGEFKRTVTMFGENTDAARAKFREEIEETHRLFKNFVQQNRPSVDIAKVSTGEHWHGIQAVELNLVDELSTSDDYLLEKSRVADLYEVTFTARKTWTARLTAFVHDALGAARSNTVRDAMPDRYL